MPRPGTSDQTMVGTAASPADLFPSQGAWPSLKRLLYLQLFFVAIAAVIYGIFWAIRPESSNLLVTVVYTLCLSNLTTFTLGRLSFLYAPKPPFLILVRVLGTLAHSYSCDGHRRYSAGVLVCRSARRAVLAVPVVKLEVPLPSHHHFWPCMADLQGDQWQAGAAQPRTATGNRLGSRGTRSSRGGARTRTGNPRGPLAQGHSPSKRLQNSGNLGTRSHLRR